MVERLIVIYGDRGQTVDGIRDYSERIVEELGRHRVAVALLSLPTAGRRRRRLSRPLRSWRRLRGPARPATLVVQYSPFCYGRWGFAPWLPAWLWAVRAGGGPAVALMVHEPYVPMISPRWALMGLWQRFQLAVLRLNADVVFTSIEPWARELARQPPWETSHHLPVGSNFPDARGSRAAERLRLGVDADTVVLCCLGRDHPSWLGDHVVAAANAIASRFGRTLLLTLGAYPPSIDGLDPAVEMRVPGYLEPREVAAHLAAADLFLAPVSDGVSTRRGSLMAALQHGLPVVGTEGPLTDLPLRDAAPALQLTKVGDRQRFAATAVGLAADPAGRAAAAAAARDLYEQEFDWPVIARRLLAELPER